MNKGTIIRTVARFAFSAYSAFCVWQVAISEFSKLIDAPWLIAFCAGAIIISGWIVDFCTTWFNNDYTEIAAKHTGDMRQEKLEMKEGYVGERFFTNAEDDEFFEEEEGDANEC